MTGWVRYAVASTIAAAALTIALWTRGAEAFVHPTALLDLSPAVHHVYSAIVGLALGAAMVLATRTLTFRFRWARQLHAELRPVARGLSAPGILGLAALSAVGEEVLFRGVLQPEIGLLGQAVLFGLIHNMRGPSRWVWSFWAGGMGLLFGALFLVSGSLVGPILAHALINALNLSHLKHHDVEATPRPLGGLLGQRL